MRKVNWDRVASLSLGIITLIVLVSFFVLKGGNSADIKELETKIDVLEVKLEQAEDSVKEAYDKNIAEMSDYNLHDMELVKLNTQGELYLFINNGTGMLIGDVYENEFEFIEEELKHCGISDVTHIVMQSNDYAGFMPIIEKYQPEYLFYRGADVVDENTDVVIKNLEKKGKLVLPLYTPSDYDGDQIRSEVESSYKLENIGFVQSLTVHLDEDNNIRCEIEFYGGKLEL